MPSSASAAPHYVLKMDVIIVPQPAVDAEHPTSLAQNSVTVINLMTAEAPRQSKRLQ